MIITVEQWLPVTYPRAKKGLYEISTHGRIRNAITKKIKKVHKDPDGYFRCVIMIDINEPRSVPIHRIVAWEHCEGYSEKNNIVNHIDTNKTNNYFANLEWCDIRYNSKHAYDNGLIVVGEDRKDSCYTNQIVHDICKLLEEGYGQGQIYNEILKYDIISGKERMTVIRFIKDLRRRKSWRHINKLYNY